MKIMIFGDQGFVGTETAKLLADRNHEVFGFDIMNRQDIRDKSQVFKELERVGPDRALHLAAISRFAEADKNPELAFETNVTGTKNVAEACAKLHVPLVYASTGSVCMPIMEEPPITEEFQGRGNSVYGCTKYLGELFVRKNTPHIVLRYAHLYGREKRLHGLIGGFLERINRGLAPVLYGGKQVNDFTYIKDVAEANCLALLATWDSWNQIYNIGTGEELSAEEAGRILCELAGYTGKIEVKEGRTVDPSKFVFDISKAERMLKFKAKFSYREGLLDMFKEDERLGLNTAWK